MSSEYWDETDVVRWLEQKGFRGFKACNYCYLYKDEEITISVFTDEYPNYRLMNRVAAESVRTFDKWTTTYYVDEFPQTDADRDAMLSLLREIGNDFHTQRANNFFRIGEVEEEGFG